MHVGDERTLLDSIYLIGFAVLMIGTIILFWYGFKKLDDSGDEEEETVAGHGHSHQAHGPSESKAPDLEVR